MWFHIVLHTYTNTTTHSMKACTAYTSQHTVLLGFKMFTLGN